MARRKFNDGQEITYQDLDAVSPALERLVLDRVLPELTRGLYDRVFGNGLKVAYVNGTTVSISAGLGIFRDTAQTSPEPLKRLLYQAASSNHTIDTPHATQNRVDIISVKGVLAEELTGTRKFKDAGSGAISNQTFTLQDEWELDVVITKGVEDGSLAVPATPTGYMKLAELAVTAVTGLSGASAVTDKRAHFPVEGYDAVVGTSAHCTHSSLAEAVADAAILSGMRIKIENNETISTAVDITKTNLILDFLGGVTFTKGGSATEALKLNAAGIRVNGGRFSGFSGGGDRGIRVMSGANYAILLGQRFNSCTLDVQDDAGNATILANVIE
jgi:hypothetical protein